ncbi:MAG TPA: 2-succinyl-5-enolpyruvyl-6-hydroxy-3-cyclohexene-1-carboxylic-acid synthase, partial [Myxococcota bacterium]|nr:2-succinyl-5-enolpyruvyl-6-hydroxy-3-cyclohexene-1-carboxylic-acid synthase [Myxococcota bacterium]
MSVVQYNATWARTLADNLRRPVVVSPGSRSTPLVLAYAAQPNVELHCVLDERSAGFFALGLARATGRAAVLICTSGSAVAHYLPALAEANASHVPLVVLTADRPPELHHCGAPQTMDQNRIFGAHVRWFCDIGAPHGDVSPRWLRTVAAQALDHAEGAQPGPVHINVPMREPLWEPDSDAASGLA